MRGRTAKGDARQGELTAGEKLSYGLGSFGNNIIYGLMTTYLMVYFTDYFGLPAAAVGTLFLVARIWDAFNDPVTGYIIDNTSTRWGRFRPYLVVGPIVTGVIVVLIFSSPDLTPGGKLIWAYVTYIAFGMGFDFMDIPYWSMTATLTQNPQERNKVVMIPRALATLAIICVNVVTLPLVSALGGDSPKRGWLLVAALFSITCIILTLITFFNVKERAQAKEKEKHSLRDVLRLFRENRPLRVLIFSMLIGDIVLAVKTIFAVYYLTYNFGAEAMIPAFMGIYAVVTGAGAVASPAFSKSFGKKKAAAFGYLISGVSSVAMFFSGYHSVALLIIWNVFGGFGDGLSDIARMSMLADTVEYGQWKTGKRQEAIVFSTNILKTKISSAVAAAICAFTLSAVGYVPQGEQTVTALNGMHAVFTAVPGLIALLALIPLNRYDLTEEKYLMVLEELKRRENVE